MSLIHSALGFSGAPVLLEMFKIFVVYGLLVFSLMMLGGFFGWSILILNTSGHCSLCKSFVSVSYVVVLYFVC